MSLVGVAAVDCIVGPPAAVDEAGHEATATLEGTVAVEDLSNQVACVGLATSVPSRQTAMDAYQDLTVSTS